MALENAAYVALRLNRTLILPPITTNSHDKYNSNQRWSEFFDIPRFTALTGVQVVEWNDIRPLTKEQIAVGKRQVHLGGKSFPLWDSLAANLTCQVIYGFGDSERLHTTELTFSRQFLFRPTFVRPPPRNPKMPIFSRLKIGAKDNTNLEDIVTFDDLLDRYEGNQEQLLFLSHTFKLKDPIGGRSWEAVGKHLHFLPKVTDYATRLIRHRAPEAGESGRYIAIHVRRGDIWQKCRAKSGDGMMACITPLGRYVESVEKARQMIGERLPVIVTTDSKSEEDHVTMARMGWRRLDHEMYTTEEELGIFGPAMVDAAILADAEIFIGTYVSSQNSLISILDETSAAACQAFHPQENQDSVTVLTLQVPPLVEVTGDGTSTTRVKEQKEAFFNICLDTSGSMSGAAIQCAKEAMQRLITHLIHNCAVPPSRITIYLYSTVCYVRQLGDEEADKRWLRSVNASGGTSFACVFNEVVRVTKANIQEVGRTDVDIDTTLFFFTDGADGDPGHLRLAKQNLEKLLKDTPQLESTVHTFGFTSGHDAKLLSWLTSTGTENGCFQYIKESGAIESSMSTTLDLLGDSAMVPQRKIEIRLSDAVDEEWFPVKLERDGVSGSTVIREKPFNTNTNSIQWREHQPSSTEDSDANVVDGFNNGAIQEMRVEWLAEDDVRRIIGMTSFIQHELLRLVEVINKISTTSGSADQKREKLQEIDVQTEAYSRTLGTMAFAAAKLKSKAAREPCMLACQRTRSVLQSFLSLKADAHKQGGAISNTSLATFNALAYGQITEAKLKAKLDSRAGKNIALFADLDEKVEKIVEGLDLDKIEADESEDRLRELSCAFSTNSYVDALRDGDCLCMTLDVSRTAGAIADPSQLVVKSIFPTFLTSSMFTMALGHSLSQNDPEDVHGGFDRNCDASIAPGLAHENITAVMPLYINEQHWQVAKMRLKPILGYVVTLDATGYTYSQSTTVPFLVLAKALEAYPMTEFKQRQIRLILETCDAIYRNSRSLRESTKTLVEQFCASHTQRTVDVITNNFVFLGHVICAVRANDITAAEMAAFMPRFEAVMVEEQIRRDMSWRVSEDLMGSVISWFNVDRQRDIVLPGRRYREQHDAYVRALESQGANAGEEVPYRLLFQNAQAAQEGVARKKEEGKDVSSITTTMSSLSISDTPLTPPEFKVPELDPVAWELSELSLDRLSLIQNAVSTGVDKIRRLMAVAQSPTDADLTQVLISRLGGVAPSNLSDEFFAKYSPKVNLATLLQAYAHTKNADRRSVETLMTPFECEMSDGADQSSDESLQFLMSLYRAKMSQMVNGIVNAVEEEYLESKKNSAAVVFLGTEDLEVAAGVLLTAGTRGGGGGQLVTLCSHSRMKLPRAKIQMLITGTYKGVRLFKDKSGSGNGTTVEFFTAIE
ncbi:hypothetical protein BGZ51_004523 [Haplosporangium sp. Z 767]|nr:hypothetical protein BGZ51_004523 [Haplosporangium sp. Z 767]